ncbi:MAG: TlpA disulfide reductase family protein [Gemmatimonadota bacterium]|nr:TlpA disulfide reductase family protein [Gemmatimonadota bacterium]
MKRKFFRSPYLWAGVGVAAIVLVAWLGRESYRPVSTGTQAPNFTARTLDGGEASLDTYEGNVVLLNIWATWCAPCREEMPSMQRLYEEFEDEDFEIVAVSVDARAGETDESGNPGGDIRAFVDQFGLTFPILHDPAGDIQRIYQTTGVPETFLIGKDGIIYKKVAGGTHWDADVNVGLVRRLLEG